MLDGNFTEFGDGVDGNRCKTGETLGVDPIAVLGERKSELVQEVLSGSVGDPGVPWASLAQHRGDGTEPIGNLSRYGNLLEFRRTDERLEVIQVSTEVVEGHHRQSEADEGIVRIVPLRPLGVHPDAPARHEVGEFGQSRHQELLNQRDEIHLFLSPQQLPVTTDGVGPGGGA